MNRKSVYLFFILTSVVAYLSSCKEEEPQPPVTQQGFHYQYVPTNVGHEVVYDVQLIVKDEFTGIQDTTSYQLKELIESTFTDIAGRPTQRLERYVRSDSSAAWVINDVWTSNLMKDRFENNEENNTYVKLRFPITLGLEWNGNLFNGQQEKTYTYTAIHQPYTINSFSLDSTITVLQDDYEDLLEKRFELERYATGIGMVYKEATYIEKEFNSPGAIRSQTRYIQKLISFSN
ncbi:MAG: hypothetical protein RL090_155 [Bacteroidota bacterium]|jgi:hypothetical protein